LQRLPRRLKPANRNLQHPGKPLAPREAERAAYDAVFERYVFAGLMLQPFSPYLRVVQPYQFPPLPFDVSELEKRGICIPDDVRAASGYRELLELLVVYARRGLPELRPSIPSREGGHPSALSGRTDPAGRRPPQQDSRVRRLAQADFQCRS
jgi:hypothetical protein